MLNFAEVGEKQEQGFKITDLKDADWCFECLKDAKTKITKKQELAEGKIKNITDWLEQSIKYDKETIEYFESLLKQYYLEEKRKNKRFKLDVPAGKVSSRKTSKWTYEDEKVKSWLKENGHTEFLKVKEELDKVNIKKAFKNGIDADTGECIEGITIEEVESISVKVE